MQRVGLPLLAKVVKTLCEPPIAADAPVELMWVVRNSLAKVVLAYAGSSPAKRVVGVSSTDGPNMLLTPTNLEPSSCAGTDEVSAELFSAQMVYNMLACRSEVHFAKILHGLCLNFDRSTPMSRAMRAHVEEKQRAEAAAAAKVAADRARKAHAQRIIKNVMETIVCSIERASVEAKGDRGALRQ